jgi:propane monooxygenase reductase subunit
MPSVEVLPAGVRFDCGENEPVLAAAIRAGLSLPYGCRKGNCGTCKAQVLDGEAFLEVESIYSLSDFERDQGFTLLCSAFPATDLVVEMEGLDRDTLETELTPPRTINGRVAWISHLTHDIRGLAIDLEEPLQFRAGQFAELNAPGTGVWRSYSMANPPSRPDRAEFIVKLVPEGACSGHLARLHGGEPIQLRAPHGSFWIRDGERPLLLIGGGAGLGPLWSMLQDLAEHGDPRAVHFFYGARTPADLFQLDQIAAVGNRLDNFTLTVALSEDPPGAGKGFAGGPVTDVVHAALSTDIAHCDAYLCGPPPMVDAALTLLEGHKLEERRSIFYDKFTPS